MSPYDEIETELAYQTSRFGHSVDDAMNTPWMWVAYIAQYAARWMTGSFVPLGEKSVDLFRECMVKVAAIAIAAIRSIDRQRAANGKCFFE